MGPNRTMQSKNDSLYKKYGIKGLGDLKPAHFEKFMFYIRNGITPLLAKQNCTRRYDKPLAAIKKRSAKNKNRRLERSKEREKKAKKEEPIVLPLGFRNMAVLPKNYPTTVLTESQIKEVEKLIMEKSKGTQYVFNGSKIGSGFLVLSCKNDGAVLWLREIVKVLTPLNYGELMAVDELQLPAGKLVSFLLPNSSGMELEKIMAIIKAQNKSCLVETWQMVWRTEKKYFAWITFVVTKIVAELINKRERGLNYMLGRCKIYMNEIGSDMPPKPKVNLNDR